jgi:hypothetical protein
VSWEETGDVVEVNMVAVWLGSHAKQVHKKIRALVHKGTVSLDGYLSFFFIGR